MSARKNLLLLATLCEEAKGPVRELDAEIFARICLSQSIPLLLWEPGWVAHNEKSVEAPAFTASLDAAMQLVPEGCDWERHRDFFVVIFQIADGKNVGMSHGLQPIPALALCAAALRARAEAMP